MVSDPQAWEVLIQYFFPYSMNIIYLFDVKVPHIENWNRMQNVCCRQPNFYRVSFFVGEFVSLCTDCPYLMVPSFRSPSPFFFPRNTVKPFKFLLVFKKFFEDLLLLFNI